MARQMPKAGFYILLPGVGTSIHGNQYTIEGQIVYTTGVRGGGGHKYWRDYMGNAKKVIPLNVNQWATLMWTCVPGKDELASDYFYEAAAHKAIALLRSGKTRKL